MPEPRDPLRFYDLEQFLFDDVHHRFARQGWIDAFDFFSVVIWKANRAKSRIARRLLSGDKLRRSDLDAVVKDLTTRLSTALEPRERLRILLEDWRFQLPMASALLSVLWPSDFSVYDVRACEQLEDFERLGTLTRFDQVWDGYCRYVERVRAANPERSLRDSDRCLWASSVAEQLRRDIGTRFERSESPKRP